MKQLTCLCLAGILSAQAFAQDMHYWTHQFGTRAALLGGAAVGGIRDNTAIYYNPAAMAFIDSASLAVNANLYQLENIRVKNAYGQEKDLASLNLGTLPLMVGGGIKTRNPKMRLGYGIIRPMSFAVRGTARTAGFYEIAEGNESPGVEEYTGQSSVSLELQQTNAILGHSWQLNPYWSVGLSHNFQARTHAYLAGTTVRMFLNNASKTMVAVNDIEIVRYTHVSYQPKIGVNYQRNKWALGATLTLPAFKILGKGTVTADISGNSVRIQGTSRVDFTGNDFQPKLKTKFKYPLSISAGSVYHGYRQRLAFTAAYFAGIKTYNILSPAPNQFLRPAQFFPESTSDKFLQVKYAAKPVVNVAVGWEKDLTEAVMLSLAARTDFSAYDAAVKATPGIAPYLTTWDLYHFTGGVTVRKKRQSFSIGLNTAFGSDKNYQQSVNLDNPTEGNFLQGQLQLAQAFYFSAGLIFGFALTFR